MVNYEFRNTELSLQAAINLQITMEANTKSIWKYKIGKLHEWSKKYAITHNSSYSINMKILVNGDQTLAK